MQYGSVYVHADVTAVFPWLTYALLSDATVHKKHRRLYDARQVALRNLDMQVLKHKKELLKSTELPRRLEK